MYKLLKIKCIRIAVAYLLSSICYLVDTIKCDDLNIKMKAVNLNNHQWHQNCDFYEPVELPTFVVELELWCAVQCSGKDYCYYATVSGGTCIFCVPSHSDDNSWQTSSVTLPTDLGVYYKLGGNWRKTYEIVTVTLNQAGARAACRSDGKELLSLASIEEYETVKGMIQGYGVDFWLGLAKQGDGTWQYDDGSSDISSIWYPGNPSGDGLCAHFYGLLINDQSCGRVKYYICESYQ